jgi:hypothetical protein
LRSQHTAPPRGRMCREPCARIERPTPIALQIVAPALDATPPPNMLALDG